MVAISVYYGVLAGVTIFIINADKGDSYFRGGSSFKLKPGEVKINQETGLVRTIHGVSIYNNPSGLSRFGGAYRIDNLPKGLNIIQRGKDLTHFEVVPTNEMTIDNFQYLLDQITTIPH